MTIDPLLTLRGTPQLVEMGEECLNFRHIKISMKMDVLRCETVEGVLKELAVFCLAYNLVRS
jgi:hypothetical protein